MDFHIPLDRSRARLLYTHIRTVVHKQRKYKQTRPQSSFGYWNQTDETLDHGGNSTPHQNKRLRFQRLKLWRSYCKTFSAIEFPRDVYYMFANVYFTV